MSNFTQYFKIIYIKIKKLSIDLIGVNFDLLLNNIYSIYGIICLLPPKSLSKTSAIISLQSVYTRTSASVFEISIWNFAHFLFYPEELLIRWNRRYRIIIAYSCHTNQMMGIKCLHRKLSHLTRYLQKICHE